MNDHNIKMGTAILENKANAKKIQKAGRNYIKKVKNEKIEQDNINKEYLSSIFPQNEKFDEENPYGKVEVKYSLFILSCSIFSFFTFFI